ncbi:CBS domain-containing protein [Vitiosangium sp. GDMCC 1.1324]|uniref:CBS domain-containing protein n=1 Tax=Vitiosangium sp. (strain GDMCC 1.1324) TaxID=2138576 RepID=UPI000D35ACC8|nr:CBS domain-containing protein [Vitiosangium sp. GDMCC 1.1324]PTL79601.1 CBS domain-containing protein [Vitiosangium sp. GDMCC 1.1324]
MAQRHTEDGRPNGTPSFVGEERERERRAAEAPPGSRERSESDVTGWSPERDETSEVREGRFHRAALLRLAQPRTEQGAPPPQDDTMHDVGPQRRHLLGRRRSMQRTEGGTYGPYGRDDRSLESSSGVGAGPLMGEQDREHSLESQHPEREYRPWDRAGTGSERASAAERGSRAEKRVPRETRGGYEQRHYAEREWEDRRGPEGTGEVYSGLVGMGQPVPPREEPRRQGRWQREPLTARELMTRHVKSVHLNSSLRDVARVMKEEDCGIVPVVDERGRLRGVLTDRDLVIRTLAEGRPPDNMHARDVMTDDVEATTPDEDILSIIELMGLRQVRRVPVVERDDRLAGIISMADIATRADYDEELQKALDRISARRSFWSRLY